MTLQEIVRGLDQGGLGLTIYAAVPWQASTKAIVTRPRDNGAVPEEAAAVGCTYFLEVHIALTLLHQFSIERDREPGEREKCARLIEYAEWLRSDVSSLPLTYKGWKFPIKMMIRCNECGRHSDIVVSSTDSEDHRCPACGKVQGFALEAFVKKAIDQTKKMGKGTRRSR
jgi:predicted nucleic acid-binding Zn ribbon protein